MARKVDKEVLVGFIEEARGYLPIIRRRIETFRNDPDRLDAMEEAHRHTHTIKGASAMVGLAGLSHIAYYVEQVLEEIAAGELEMDEASSFLRKAVAQIEGYLDGVLKGTLHERPLLAEVTRDHRRLHGLPLEEDEAAVEEVLAEVASAPTVEVIDKGQPQPVPPVPGTSAEGWAEGTSAAAGPSPAGSATVDEVAHFEEISPELLEAFSLEAEDHLRNVSNLLSALDKQPEEKELMQDMRRSVHTLKGAAGAVGLRAIAHLTHRMEDLLELLYAGTLALTPDVMDLLFDSTDTLEDMAAGKVEAETVQATLQDLYARYATWVGQVPSEEATGWTPVRKIEPLGEEPVIDLAELAPRLDEADGSEPRSAKEAASPAPRTPTQVVRVPIERLDELVRLVSELVISRSTFEQRMSDFGRMADELGLSVDRLRRVSLTMETEYEVSTLGGGFTLYPAGQDDAQREPRPMFNTHGFDALEFDRYTEFHRLSRELAETTSDVNTVGHELTNLIGDFDSILSRQGRLSSELQDKLMRVRMVPLATLATRLHRTVRVLAREQGKLVDLELEGDDIELDKTVLEEMADPLLHLLRNAVDHGIEPSALRQVTGKPERGTIRMRAFHEGNQVVIQVSDDGAGLEPQLLRSAAISGGYISSADAPQLSDEELYSLIFLTGFTTAGEVSEVSGRGVGLDVVKTNVHKLKGTVTIDGEPGQGTTFTIRLPMTLAVTRALLIRAHGETFAIPLDAVTQILRLEREEVEQVGQEPVVRSAGQVYPMLRLGEVLNLKQPADETVQRLPVLILNAEGRQVALVVDQLLSGREIVIKTLGNHLRRVHGVTGATLMGDGSVVLILNPGDLVSEPAQQASAAWTVARAAAAARETLSVMIVDDSMSVRRVVSNLIQSAGWQPVSARDGLEALEIIHHSVQLPELILLDIEMPRMDGYEFMSILKGQEAYRDIPIVILTSRAGEKHRRKALDLGASEYVVKPYQDEVLLSMIRHLVQVSKKVVPA